MVWKSKEPIVIMILRILLACVFIYSGLTKAIDPVGTAYTFDGYFFSFRMSFLQIFSTFAAFVMPMIEFGLGIMMLLRVKIKLTSLLYLIMMSFFFLLTAWLALAEHLELKYHYNLGVVKDCGCFGAAIKLSNLQTFLKNVVIMVPTILIFIYRKRIPDIRMTELGKWLTVAATCCACLVLEAHCYRHLPIVDHSDWNTCTDLTKDYLGKDLIEEKGFMAWDPSIQDSIFMTEDELMAFFDTDEGAAYASTLEFDDNNIVTKVIQPYERAKNYNFMMKDTADVDLTPTLITHNNTRPLFLLFMQDLDEVNMKGLKGAELKKILEYCAKNDCDFYGITNTPRAEINKFVKEHNIPFQILCCDYYDPIKGPFFVRDAIHSNPGLIQLQNGMVRGKWAWRDFDEVLESEN